MRTTLRHFCVTSMMALAACVGSFAGQSNAAPIACVPWAASLLGQTLPVPGDFVYGQKWGDPTLGTPAVVTWSFETNNASQVQLSTFMPTGYDDEVREAFATWSSVANISFVEVPSGGQIKLFGQAIDGPGGTAGQGKYPGTGSSYVRFDTGNTWTTDPNGSGSYIYQLALHEIGHTIGLMHPPGISAAMNHVVTSAFEGLLPTDIAGAQAIYGPAPGIDNSQYIPTNVVTLNVDPASQLTVTLSIPGLLSLEQSTTIGGTIDAHIDGLHSSDPTALTFYGSNLNIDDLSVDLHNGFIDAHADLNGLVANLFNKDWFGPSGHLTDITGGMFSVDSAIVGLVDGEVNYNVAIPALSVSASDSLDLYQGENVGPVSFAPLQSGPLGTIARLGSLVSLEIPLSVQSTIYIPAAGISIPLDITVSGTLLASVAVPEIGSSTLLIVASMPVAWIVVCRRRRSIAAE